MAIRDWFVMCVVTVVLVLGTRVSHANAEAVRECDASFVYTPFPAIPVVAVESNNLASGLAKVCRALRGKELPAPVARAAGVDPATRPLRLAFDALEEASEAAQEFAAVEAQLAVLKHACAAMGAFSAEPKPLSVEALVLLRELRDEPDELLILIKWSEKDSAFALESLAEAKEEAGQLSGLDAPSASFSVLSDQVIRGLADFIADRAKQEALHYVEERLKARICTCELRPFFANTCGVLDTLDAGQRLHAIGIVVRAAAEADLRVLPDVALDYARTQASTDDLILAGRVSVAVASAAWKGRAPLDVFAALGAVDLEAQCDGADAQCKSVRTSLQHASAFVYAMQQSGDTLHNLRRAELGPVSVATVLLAEKRLNDTSGEPLPADQLSTGLAEVAQLIARVIELQRRWNEVLAVSAEIVGDERRGRTMDALTSTVNDLSVVFERVGPSGKLSTHAVLMRRFADVTKAIESRTYGTAATELVALLKTIPSDDKLPGSVRTLIPLIAELANAESSTEVAAVFESYAAPLGSYEEKFRRSMITLNAMLGIHGGGERVAVDNASGTSAMFAGFAPVGVHLTTPTCSSHGEDLCSAHLGILVTLIDLGALTTYRVEEELKPEGASGTDADPKADSAPQIGFGQVFSPGVYGTLGIGGTPFVLGIGASFTPGLRRVTDADTSTQATAFRFGGFIAVDVPLLPL